MKVFGIMGYSGSGKTTLIEGLITRFTARGLNVSLIKHAHHGFDIDRPGKDSFRHREAGAREVMLLSDQRWVLMHEARDELPPQLGPMIARLSPCDLVLLESFKTAAVDKLEVYRPSLGKPPIWPGCEGVVAVASDVEVDCPLPVLDLNDHGVVAGWVLRHTGLG
jgi:molybdopterin-guanine dinucleotide biosynthesis adapter protein